MTNNGQTPGGNTTTAGAVEQLAISIANDVTPEYIARHRYAEAWAVAKDAALAAIIETTEAAAKFVERIVPPPGIDASSNAAIRLRNNDHLKGPKP